jgi:hypothetical protein
MAGEIATADTAAAGKFPLFLKQMTDEGGYSPKQVFNIDETSLFWKQIANKT